MKYARTDSDMIRLATQIYRVLLVLYPPRFRSEYGAPMVQAFRTASVERMSHQSGWAIVRFWLHVLTDLLRSALLERTTSVAIQIRRGVACSYALAVIVSVISGMVHLWADADRVSGVLLLAGTFACGTTTSHRPWRWGVVAGIGIPLAIVLAHSTGSVHFTRHDSDSPFASAMFVAMVGAYTGALVRIIAATGPRISHANSSRSG